LKRESILDDVIFYFVVILLPRIFFDKVTNTGTMTENQSTSASPNKDPPVSVIEKQTQRRIFKIIVIGDSNVGKTCLTYRFCTGKFPDKTEATIGVDFRERTVDVDKEQIKVICGLW
jgi:GTP-binding protein EngB required for normal cell division